MTKTAIAKVTSRVKVMVQLSREAAASLPCSPIRFRHEKSDDDDGRRDGEADRGDDLHGCRRWRLLAVHSTPLRHTCAEPIAMKTPAMGKRICDAVKTRGTFRIIPHSRRPRVAESPNPTKPTLLVQLAELLGEEFGAAGGGLVEPLSELVALARLEELEQVVELARKRVRESVRLSRLSRKMSRQSPPSPPAMRVVSRKPLPASGKCGVVLHRDQRGGDGVREVADVADRADRARRADMRVVRHAEQPPERFDRREGGGVGARRRA